MNPNLPDPGENEGGKPSTIECPKCHEHFPIDIVAKFRDHTRTKITAKKKTGQMFTASDVAGLIGSYGKLLTAVGRQMGAKLLVAVEEIELKGDELTVTFMAARIVKGESK